ncbi:MAG TPA: Calx-beta domain-containing protein [Tepidisphaeraceae bacterium]|jgi:hypothetical protein|nr:Calx-beta domain-containing protein [Tepidisphaeraceae bacterium]
MRFSLFETLELRRLLTATPSFTVTFDDPAGTYASWYNTVRATVLASASDWAQYINSSAKIDLSVDFDSTLTDPTLAEAGFDRRVFFAQSNGFQLDIGNVAAELRTGVDQNGSQPDAEISIRPGALSDFFFDSTSTRTATVPSDLIDARSVLTHEIGHALGFFGDDYPFSGNRLVYDQYIEQVNGDLYFDGPNAEAAYGGPVPMAHDDTSHIGNDDGPGQDLDDDLMSPSIPPGDKRFISAVDLGMLADAGVPMKTTLIPVIQAADVVANRATAKSANFVLTLSKPSNQTITVPVSTFNGTALAGRDYVALSKTVTFAPGQTSATASVKLLPGSPFDSDKTFTLNLGIPTNAALLTGQITATLRNKILAAGAGHTVSFTDPSKNVVTISLRGPGTAIVNLDSAGYLDTISLTGTATSSILSISSKKPSTIHAITDASSLGSISAPNTDLLGTFKFIGTSSATFLDILAGSRLTFKSPSPLLAVVARNITDSSVTSTGSIKSFSAHSWTNTDDTPDLLKATSFSAITIKALMQANITSASTIGAFTATTFSNATLHAASFVTTITLGSSLSSNIFIGTALFAQSSADFTSKKSTLSSITIKSTFSNTHISAFAITTANLGTITTDNASIAFGLSTDSLTTLTASTPLFPHFKRSHLKSPQTYAEDDFLLDVL